MYFKLKNNYIYKSTQVLLYNRLSKINCPVKLCALWYIYQWKYMYFIFCIFRYLLGDLRFGHSDTMDPFYSSIGLFKDSIPPRADNFLTMRNRVFYESKITTFSAHVAFILYNCGGSGPHNYKLKMMVNGEVMRIPGCDSDLCPYLKVRDLYSRYIDECHWKDLCTVRTNSPIVVG